MGFKSLKLKFWVSFIVGLAFLWPSLGYSLPRVDRPKIPYKKQNVHKIAEGFYGYDEVALPKAVDKNWDSIFLVQAKEADSELYAFGTAFLIETSQDSKGQDLYFLTNNHVVRNSSEITIYKESEINVTDFGFEQESYELQIDNVKILKSLEQPDLALMHVRIKKDVDVPKPVKFSEDCQLQQKEELFIIGFPTVSLRTAKNHLPIHDQKKVYKRWSKGISLGIREFNLEENQQVINGLATTADAIGGNSGGPVLNQNGDLVAVLMGANVDESGGYKGSEDPNNLKFHSTAISCTIVKDFVQDYLEGGS